jgi:hypothetical protein
MAVVIGTSNVGCRYSGAGLSRVKQLEATSSNSTYLRRGYQNRDPARPPMAIRVTRSGICRALRRGIPRHEPQQLNRDPM